MFEEIARENGIERPVVEGPSGGTVLMEKRDVLTEARACSGIQVHAKPASGPDLIDELAPSAAEIEHGARLRHELLEEVANQYRPDTQTVIPRITEPAVVGALQIDGVERHAGWLAPATRPCHESTISRIVSWSVFVIVPRRPAERRAG